MNNGCLEVNRANKRNRSRKREALRHGLCPHGRHSNVMFQEELYRDMNCAEGQKKLRDFRSQVVVACQFVRDLCGFFTEECVSNCIP